MNTYYQTLYKVKKTKSGSDEISQGQYRGYPSKEKSSGIRLPQDAGRVDGGRNG